MIAALCPAMKDKIPSRWTLSRTFLPKLYEDTKEKIEKALSEIPTRKTAIIDGFKDRTGRHVMNMSYGTIGFVTYLGTGWFGTRRHSGDTYGSQLEQTLGDKIDNTVAIVADNTSSMSSMRVGLFAFFAREYPRIFLLGCVVHMYDLLQEDIIKLLFVAAIASEAKEIVKFLLRRVPAFAELARVDRTFVEPKKKSTGCSRGVAATPRPRGSERIASALSSTGRAHGRTSMPRGPSGADVDGRSASRPRRRRGAAVAPLVLAKKQTAESAHGNAS